MIGDWTATGLIALGCSLCSELAKWARLSSFRARPIKPVFLSRLAHDSLRINTSAKTGWIERGIFILRLDIRETHLDCGELVATDASAQYFIEAGLAIELPLTTFVDERNWKGPIIVANKKGLGAIAFHLNGVLGFVGGYKILPNLAIGYGIARANDRLTVRPQYLKNRLRISRSGSSDQGLDRCLGIPELFLGQAWHTKTKERGGNDKAACFYDHGNTINLSALR